MVVPSPKPTIQPHLEPRPSIRSNVSSSYIDVSFLSTVVVLSFDLELQKYHQVSTNPRCQRSSAVNSQPGQKLAFASLRSSSLASFFFLKIQNTTATTATKPMTVTRIEAIVRADQSLPGFTLVYGELVRAVDVVSRTTCIAAGDADIVSFEIWY